MADTATAPTSAPAQASSPKKGKSAGSKKPRVKPAHPKTSEMVASAIKSLKERGGSSLQAIKKYVAANYKVDAEKLAPFIKKYLKSAVQSGELVQTKGKGASGSFRLASSGSSAPSKSSEGKSKRAAPAKEKKKKAATKKPKASPKKASSKKSGAAAAEKKKAPSSAAPKPKKSPSKAKKVSKPPTKKPRAPKPKKAAPKPKTPKKAAAKKK